MNPQTKRTRISQTGLYFAAMLVVGMFLAVVGATLPNLAEQTQVGVGKIGLVLTFSSLGFLIGNFTVGRLYDRFKGHHIIRVGLVGMAVLIAMIPFIHKLEWMFPTFLMIGFFRSMIIIGTNTLPLWIYGEKAGAIMNTNTFFFGAGSFLGPILVSQTLNLTEATDWVFWISVGVFLLILAPALLIPSPPIRREVVSDPQIDVPDTSKNDRPVILLLSLLLVFYVGVEVGFSSWLTTYARSQLPIEQLHRAYQLTSVFWICMMVGRLGSVPLSTKIDTKKLLLFDLGGMLIGLAIILFGRSSWEMLFAGTIVLGVSMASMFPLTFTLANEVVLVTGKVSSALFVGASSGSVVFPLVMGRVMEVISPISIMFTVLILTVLDVGIFVLLNIAIQKHQAKKQE